MLVHCRKCGHQFEYAGSPEVPAGLLLQCPKCRQLTTVPEAESALSSALSPEDQTDPEAGFAPPPAGPRPPAPPRRSPDEEETTEARQPARAAPLPPPVE